MTAVLNWRRGLKRLLVAAYVVWAGYIFFWWPLEMVKERHDHAYAMYKLNFGMDDVDAGAELSRDLQSATWGEVYPGLLREFRDEPAAMAMIVLIPLVGYLLLYGLIRSGIWLVSGFKSDGNPVP